MTFDADMAVEGDSSRLAIPRFQDTQPDILFSIHPRHTNEILAGNKTVEFRRSFPPKDHFVGTTAWIYSSAPTKAVVAVAHISLVERLPINRLWTAHREFGGIDKKTFDEYFTGTPHGTAIGLADVRHLSTQVPLASLRSYDFHVPQSYRYVTEDVSDLLRDALIETSTRHQHCDCS